MALEQVSQSLKDNPLLMQLSDSDMAQFLSKIRIVKYCKDNYVIYKNKEHRYFYIIISGQLSVYISDDKDPGKVIKVSTFIKNDICGEMAILAEDSSATADVVADEDTVLIKIPHNISDHLKLHLLKSSYSKIKKSNIKIIEYDNKINSLIKFVRLKSVFIFILFLIINLKFIVTASVPELFLSLFWALPVMSTLTTVGIIIYFKN